MKSISAAIVILAGSILLSSAGFVRTDERWLLGAVGFALGLWGAVAWYYLLAVEGSEQTPVEWKERRP